MALQVQLMALTEIPQSRRSGGCYASVVTVGFFLLFFDLVAVTGSCDDTAPTLNTPASGCRYNVNISESVRENNSIEAWTSTSTNSADLACKLT
jgi:hypothetical protein